MSRLIKALAAPAKLMQSIKDEVAKGQRLKLQDGAGWSSVFGKTSNSGKTVNITSAMQVSAVWACMKITSQAVSSLPLDVYRKSASGGREKVDGGRMADLLSNSPNRDQTSLEYWETQTAWLLARGNAYSERVTTGRLLSSLEPLAASQMTPKRNSDGELEYHFTDRGKVEIMPREKVFHIKGFGQGLSARDEGMSPISAGTNTIGAAMASQEASASTFASGMNPTGFLKFSQTLSPEQREQARKNLIEPLTGSSRAGGIGILEGDMSWQAVSLNPEDAQMLETRRFDIEEICRWFGTPPIVIGHSAEGQTMWGSGVESIFISWLMLGIDPICDRIEARIRKDLRGDLGDRRAYAEFNREALLQMDSAAKAKFLSTMTQNGLMTRNEGRDKLNLPRKEGGDVLTAQTNLAPIQSLGEPTDPATRQAIRALLQKTEETAQ